MMMQLRRWAIPAVLCAASVAGCGTKTDEVDKPTAPYPDEVAYCKGRAKAECSETVLSRCNATLDECVKKRNTLCAQGIPAAGVYRPAQAKKCIDAVKQVYLDDEYTSEDRHSEEEACAELFDGTAEVGDQCLGDYQCDLDQDLRCIIPTGQLEGSCQIPVMANPGGACGAANAMCVEGTFCSATEPYRCGDKMGEGESCGETLPCREDLRCVQIGDTAKCAAKLAKGAICTEDEQCSSGFCGKVGGGLECVDVLVISTNEAICDDFRE